MAYKDKDYPKKYYKKYYIANKEKYKKASNDWINKNKEKHTEYLRKNNLRRLYKIEISEYNELFNKQGGKCKICGKHQSELKTKLSVDHCHQSGIIRGLLCTKCNVLLGMAENNIDILMNAIKYINM